MFRFKKIEPLIRDDYRKLAASKFGDYTFPEIDNMAYNAKITELQLLMESPWWICKYAVKYIPDCLFPFVPLYNNIIIKELVKRCDEDYLKKFVSNSDEDIRLIIAKRTRLYDLILLKDSYYEIRKVIARETKFDIILDYYIYDESPYVRLEVLSHNRLSDIILSLSDDNIIVKNMAIKLYDKFVLE